GLVMTTVAATSHPAPAHHDDRSFIRKYVFTTDHKIIGIQFLFVSLFFLLVGGLLAMQMRWQLGFPGKPMQGGGMLPESMAPGGAARAGWTLYAPLSARHDLSGASFGQELWSVSIILVGLSSILGSLNYITTIINNRASGMTSFRMPLSVWSLFITAILGLLAL